MSVRQPRDRGGIPGAASLAELTPRMQMAVQGRLHPDEAVVAALAAEAGTALVATEHRIMLLHEGAGGVEITAFPRAGLRFAVESGPDGTWLRWSPAPTGLPSALAIPAARREPFARLAERLNGGAGPTTPPTACPRCAVEIPPDGAWCPACGLAVRGACWTCGRPLAPEAQFCAYCGTPATEPAEAICPGCGAPVPRDHGYCVRCGALVRPLCESCDRILRREWRYCPDCGAGIEAEERDEEPLPPPPQFPTAPAAAPIGESEEAERYNLKGIEAYEDGRLDEAIDLFSRAVGENPTVADYWVNLGVACFERDLDLEAFAACRRALELAPNHLQALLTVALLYHERERYEHARELYERIIALAPESEEAQEARRSLEHLDEL